MRGRVSSGNADEGQQPPGGGGDCPAVVPGAREDRAPRAGAQRAPAVPRGSPLGRGNRAARGPRSECPHDAHARSRSTAWQLPGPREQGSAPSAAHPGAPAWLGTGTRESPGRLRTGPPRRDGARGPFPAPHQPGTWADSAGRGHGAAVRAPDRPLGAPLYVCACARTARLPHPAPAICARSPRSASERTSPSRRARMRVPTGWTPPPAGRGLGRGRRASCPRGLRVPGAALPSLPQNEPRFPPPTRLSGSNRGSSSVRLFEALGGGGRAAPPGSQAPEEELGPSVQCARAGARPAGRQLAQGGPVVGGEAAAAQLQLLHPCGDLAPEAQAQGALDSTACRGEAGAGLRELEASATPAPVFSSLCPGGPPPRKKRTSSEDRRATAQGVGRSPGEAQNHSRKGFVGPCRSQGSRRTVPGSNIQAVTCMPLSRTMPGFPSINGHSSGACGSPEATELSRSELQGAQSAQWAQDPRELGGRMGPDAGVQWGMRSRKKPGVPCVDAHSRSLSSWRAKPGLSSPRP